MSLYKKAWLFTGFNVLVLIGLYFGLPVLDRVLGTFGLLVFGFLYSGARFDCHGFFSVARNVVCRHSWEARVCFFQLFAFPT